MLLNTVYKIVVLTEMNKVVSSLESNEKTPTGFSSMRTP